MLHVKAEFHDSGEAARQRRVAEMVVRSRLVRHRHRQTDVQTDTAAASEAGQRLTHSLPADDTHFPDRWLMADILHFLSPLQSSFSSPISMLDIWMRNTNYFSHTYKIERILNDDEKCII